MLFLRMKSLFLSPHNDDETLFGSFTLLREDPFVVVVLRSFVQENRGLGILYRHRERETEEALKVLGVSSWEQWTFPDDDPPWDLIFESMASFHPEHVYAPYPELKGHNHHNTIGEAALEIYGPENVTLYCTYAYGEITRTRGVKVEAPPEHYEQKKQALLCYQSQIHEPSTGHHFKDTLDEFYAR